MDLMRREALIETYGLAEATRMMNEEGMFEQPEIHEKYMYGGAMTQVSHTPIFACSGNIFVYKPSTGSGT